MPIVWKRNLNWNANAWVTSQTYNTGTASGTTITTGKFWNCRRKNANTDNITFWISPITWRNTFSINLWVYPTDVTNDQTIFSTDSLLSSGSFLLSILNVQLREPTARGIGFAPTINSRNNIVITVQTNTTNWLKAYLNWTLVSQVTLGTYSVSRTAFRMLERTDGTTDVVNGTLVDDFAVYNGILTATDVTNIRNSWTGNVSNLNTLSIQPAWYWTMNEASGSTVQSEPVDWFNNLTATSVTRAGGKMNWWASFNGTSSTITGAWNFTNNTSRSYSCLVKLNWYANFGWILLFDNTADNGFNWIATAGTTWTLRLKEWWGDSIINTEVLSQWIWYHMVLTYDYATWVCTAYRNWLYLWQYSGTVWYNLPSNTFQIWVLETAYRINWVIDEVEIYNHVLTQTEVTNMYLFYNWFI